MECLEMPAKTFFALLKEGRFHNQKQTDTFLYELCGVAVCANVSGPEYVERLKKFYRDRVFEDELKPDEIRAQGPIFKADDPQAGKILIDLAKQKMRLEGLSRDLNG